MRPQAAAPVKSDYSGVKAWMFQSEPDKELTTQMVNYPKKDASRIVSA